MQYLADTPDGAWAEFLRHEEIVDPADLGGVVRRLWVVQLPGDAAYATPVRLDHVISRGDFRSYPACQDHARGMRTRGVTALRAPSAALLPGGARGQLTDGGLHEAPDPDGLVWALFGPRPTLRAWAAVDAGAPTERVLHLVAHFALAPSAGRPDGVERRVGIDRRSKGERRQRNVIDLTTGAPTTAAPLRKRAP